MCYLLLYCDMTIFADDTTLHYSGLDIKNITEVLEKDLIVISEWLEFNKLILNVKKSNAMLFKWRYQRKLDELNSNIGSGFTPVIICNNESIPFVAEFTLLGITFDNKLTFNKQTTNLCIKVAWKLRVLSKSSYLFTLKFKVTLFKIFIVSKFDYC